MNGSELVEERHGVAVLAVGGYGCRELCPGSDLEILLPHYGQESVHKEVEYQTENLARVSS
jgi:[protein-PII] uridylyltransferase